MSAEDQTLGDALVAARKTVQEAEADFRRLLREANQRGASVRDIADLLGDVSFSTVWRWMEGGGKRKRTHVLEQPYEPKEKPRDPDREA